MSSSVLTRQDSSDEIRTNRFTFVLPTSTTGTGNGTGSGSDPSENKNKPSSDFSISELSKKVMNNLRDKSPRCGLDIFSSGSREENGENSKKFFFFICND
jgi:hypothetical protein